MLIIFDDSYAFAEFNTAEEANVAMGAMQGFHFDKEHTLILNRFTDIEKFANMDEEYAEPEPEEYKSRVRIGSIDECVRIRSSFAQEHLRAWLSDSQGRDQFLTYRIDDVTIYWHSKASPPDVATVRRVSPPSERYLTSV